MNLENRTSIVKGETCADPSGMVSADILPPACDTLGGFFVPETGGIEGVSLLLDKNRQSEGEGELSVAAGAAEELASRWQRKQSSLRMSYRIAEFDPKRAARMYKCHYEIYRNSCASCGGNESWHHDQRCGDKFCANCAKINSGELLNRYEPILNAFGKERYGYLLTLTYLNADHLRERNTIAKNMRALLARALWREFGGIAGGIYSVEVTFPNGQYHPHVHALIYTDKPIPTFKDRKGVVRWHVPFNQAVSDAWREITGDSYIVDGRAFNGCYAEVLKYVSKMHELENIPDHQLREFALWSKGMHSVATFGGVRGLVIDPEPREEKGPCPCGCTVEETVALRCDEKRGYVPVWHDHNDLSVKFDPYRYPESERATKGP